MKRCPDCDFVYEDYESLCAMDGAQLVNLSGPLPSEENTSLPAAGPTNSHGRGLTLIAAGVILSVAGFLYLHSVARRNAFQNNLQGTAKSYSASPQTEQKQDAAIPVETSVPAGSESPAVTPARTKNKAVTNPDNNWQSDRDPFNTAPSPSPAAILRSSPSFNAARAATTISPAGSGAGTVKAHETTPGARPSPVAPKEAKATNTNQNTDSKVTSFFKKTGRILKKPFKN